MARHLIHIGYPKAGSTFLQEWFEQHPDFYYCAGGLAGFQHIFEICRSPETACKYFVTSWEGLSMPPRSGRDHWLDWRREMARLPPPIKEIQKEVCSLLKTLYPDSRILIVTRGFKAIIMSGYSQYVKSGGQLHPDGVYRRLEECLRADAYHYYDYDYLIQLYADAFGEENLIVVPYELLRDNQAAFLSLLEKRLEIGHIEPGFGRLNPSLSPHEQYWYPLITRSIARLTSGLEERKFQRIYRWYVSKTLENKLRRPIKILQTLRPDRKIHEKDFPSELLEYCKGKATRLKDDPLYAPYGAEYLWNS
jgi:hypothetical protein